MQTFAQLVRQKVENNLDSGEFLCDLQCEGLFCVQRKGGYSFTTDAVLLANFINGIKNKKIVEFCSGSGVISLLVNAKRKPREIACVEIQSKLAQMNEKSLMINAIKNVVVYNQSLEAFACEHYGNFDACYCNPPYFKFGSGHLPKSEEASIAKYEIKTNLRSIISSAKQVLNKRGKLFLVHLTERLDEIKMELARSGFFINRIKYVYPNRRKQSNIVLIEAGQSPKKSRVLSGIIVHNLDGSETMQLQRIYNRNGEFSKK